MRRGGRTAIALAGMMMAGCASRDLVVVLPEPDGHVGAVLVGPGPGQVVLDQPYAAAHLGSGGPTTFRSDGARVKGEFGAALAALPARPSVYRLYFENDSTEMTTAGHEAFERVFAEIAHRPAPEIVVTGHTDTVGQPKDKDELSYERARAIAELLVARGIARDTITIAGRGDRELLKPTGDQVREPRNRRVEITVR